MSMPWSMGWLAIDAKDSSTSQLHAADAHKSFILTESPLPSRNAFSRERERASTSRILFTLSRFPLYKILCVTMTVFSCSDDQSIVP